METPKTMCCICFDMFETEQLTPVHRQRGPEHDYEDVCVRCTALEYLSEVRNWGV